MHVPLDSFVNLEIDGHAIFGDNRLSCDGCGLVDFGAAVALPIDVREGCQLIVCRQTGNFGIDGLCESNLKTVHGCRYRFDFEGRDTRPVQTLNGVWFGTADRPATICAPGN